MATSPIEPPPRMLTTFSSFRSDGIQISHRDFPVYELWLAREAALPRCLEGEKLPRARNALELVDAMRQELEARADGEIPNGA